MPVDLDGSLPKAALAHLFIRPGPNGLHRAERDRTNLMEPTRTAVTNLRVFERCRFRRRIPCLESTSQALLTAFVIDSRGTDHSAKFQPLSPLGTPLSRTL
jgi:hypothetical protein